MPCQVQSLSEEDLAHLHKIVRWGRRCTALGWATSWAGPNLLSAALLAQGRTARWTMVAHHTRLGERADPDLVEHHLWPDLTMRQHQRIQPALKALCARHGVPYVQESRRLRKTADICVGKTSMKRG